MSRRKNCVRKEWKRRLTEINTLKKRLKKNPENESLKGKIKGFLARVVPPKNKIK